MSSYGCLLLYLIHYHLHHSGLLPLLIYKLTPTVRRKLAPTFTIHLLNCSVPLYMYSSIEIVCLYSLYRHWKTLYQLEYSAYVQCLLFLVLQAPFPPVSFNEVAAEMHNAVWFYCHNLHSILGSSDLLNYYFLIRIH